MDTTEVAVALVAGTTIAAPADPVFFAAALNADLVNLTDVIAPAAMKGVELHIVFQDALGLSRVAVLGAEVLALGSAPALAVEADIVASLRALSAVIGIGLNVDALRATAGETGPTEAVTLRADLSITAGLVCLATMKGVILGVDAVIVFKDRQTCLAAAISGGAATKIGVAIVGAAAAVEEVIGEIDTFSATECLAGGADAGSRLTGGGIRTALSAAAAVVYVGGRIDTIAPAGDVSGGTGDGFTVGGFTGFADGAVVLAETAVIAIACGVDALTIAT